MFGSSGVKESFPAPEAMFTITNNKYQAMKRILFLFAISIMTHCCAVAETILPFVQNGKAWIYEASNFIYDWEDTSAWKKTP